MAEIIAPAPADIDIESEIEHLMAVYPPMAKDRRAVQVDVQDGVVTLSGHVQTPNTRDYMLSRIASVPGVRSVRADALYDDVSVRLNVARLLPDGVRLARVQYGVLVLTGKRPAGMTAEALAEQIGALPGVARIIMQFAD